MAVRFGLMLFGIILAAIRPTSAINCLVCHSLNGSNPDCETPHMTSNPTLIQTNCRSTIGSPNSNLPLMAMACVTSLGEFRRESGSPVYAISRYCTAVIPQEYQAKNILCGQIQPHGIAAEHATSPFLGCSALCTDHACNSATIVKLAFRMKEKYGYYVDDERHRDPQNIPHFPYILKIGDRLMLQYENRTRKMLTPKGHANTSMKPSDDSVVGSDITEGHFNTTVIPSNDTVSSVDPDALTSHSDTTVPAISVAALTNDTVVGSDIVSNETKSGLVDILVNIPTILLASDNVTVDAVSDTAA